VTTEHQTTEHQTTKHQTTEHQTTKHQTTEHQTTEHQTTAEHRLVFNTLQAERFQAQAQQDRREAARLLAPGAELRLGPDHAPLHARLASLLNEVACLRDACAADLLPGRAVPGQTRQETEVARLYTLYLAARRLQEADHRLSSDGRFPDGREATGAEQAVAYTRSHAIDVTAARRAYKQAQAGLNRARYLALNWPSPDPDLA